MEEKEREGSGALEGEFKEDNKSSKKNGEGCKDEVTEWRREIKI
jgi:hypothetical protein